MCDCDEIWFYNSLHSWFQELKAALDQVPVCDVMAKVLGI